MAVFCDKSPFLSRGSVFLCQIISWFVDFCVYLRYEIKIIIIIHMKEFAKYFGVIVMLIGVAVLVMPFLMGSTTNTNLIIGLLLVVEGMLGHIFINNMKKGSKLSNLIWAIIMLIIPYVIFLFFKKKAYSEEEIAAYN